MSDGLTVAIPTFDRRKQLKNAVTKLLAQLGSDDQLLILDNNSSQKLDGMLAEILPKGFPAELKLLRNHANVGFSANILRCFENADCRWMWLLGDDDEVKSDAVAKIKNVLAESSGKAIEQRPLFINFSSEIHRYRQDENCVNLAEFLEKMSLGSVLFMSSGVYRLTHLKQRLADAHFFVHTAAPHLALLLLELIDAEKNNRPRQCLLKTQQIVSWQASDMSSHGEWLQEVKFSRLVLKLLELPLDIKSKQKLFAKISGEYSSPTQLFLSAYKKLKQKNLDEQTFSYELGELFAKSLPLTTDSKQRTNWKILRFIAARPKLIPLVLKLWPGMGRAARKVLAGD